MANEQQPDRAPLLPLRPGPVSNGEFVPAAPSARDRWVAQETLRRAGESADRLGMDRRRFLQTAGGMSAMLAVLNVAACSSGTRKGARPATSTSPSTSATTATSKPGGTFTAPPSTDLPACESALANQGEFIFDVHTHHVMPDRPWRANAPETVSLVLGMLPADCREADRLTCANRAAYIHDLFLASDTTVALLSDVPSSGPADAPLPFDDKIGTQDMVAQLAHGGAPRVLVHDVIAPNVGDVRGVLDEMAATAEGGHVAAFKVYTAWGPTGQGFALDDPRLGLPVVQQAHDLGVKVFCGHKGLPLVQFDLRYNGPRDMVAVSRLFPDMQFVIFHGAWDPNTTEGPYDAARTAVGIDSLVKALDDHGVGPNQNVWADLGTTWRTLLNQPDQAAHALGKLLSKVGEDRVLWGTDAIWYGSPQPQIMAFRAFQISAEYQQRFGYPALTDEVKRKVLGLNAATLFGLDPTATRCALQTSGVSLARPEQQHLVATGALPEPWQPRGPISRRDALSWLASPGTHWAPG